MSKSIDHTSNSYGVLHLLGAIMVLYGHQYALMQFPVPVLLGNQIQALGVKIIFVISGYLIAGSFLKDCNLGRFMVKRILRIFPALAVCILFTIFIIGPMMSASSILDYFRGAWEYFWKNLFLCPHYILPGVFIDNPYPIAVNGSLWTMPLEVSLYVLVALILSCISRIRNNTAQKIIMGFFAVLFALASLIRLYVMPSDLRWVFWGTDWASASTIGDAAYFMIGSFLRVADIKRYLSLPVASLILLFASTLSYRYIEAISLLVIPYFVLSFSENGVPFLSSWVERHNISYGVYLYGFPVQQTLLGLIWVLADIKVSPNAFFIASLIITGLLAMASRNLIEQPASELAKKITKTDAR